MPEPLPARRLGRLSAAERAARLCDPGTFAREGATLRGADPSSPPGDGLVAGVGLVAGRPVTVIATDGRVLRGTLGAAGAALATRLLEAARRAAHPVVLLLDSDGARQREGLSAVTANARLLATLADLGGHVPRLAALFGAAAGSAAYALALSDLAVAIADRSFAFVAGPAVVTAALGESPTLDALGGTDRHAATGLLHATVPADDDALAWLRAALALLPSSAHDAAPFAAPRPAPSLTALTAALPADTRQAWDFTRAIDAIADADSWLELAPAHGPSIRTGLARLAGRPLLLVTSAPTSLAGAIDAAASRKLARMVRLATAFGLPILTLADTPGFLPGTASEAAAVLCHGAAVIAAYAEASRWVPRVALVLRRAVGAGTVLAAEAEVVLALPDAAIAQMGDAALRAASAAAGLSLPEHAPLTPEEAGFAHRVIAPEAARAELERAFSRLPAPPPPPPGTRRLSLLPL